MRWSPRSGRCSTRKSDGGHSDTKRERIRLVNELPKDTRLRFVLVSRPHVSNKSDGFNFGISSHDLVVSA
jgi:hypothetical protein